MPQKLDTHEVPGRYKTAVQHRLCYREYNLLDHYYPDLLRDIEAAVKAGATPQEVRRWARDITKEQDLLQRVENAARYVASQSEPVSALEKYRVRE